MPREAPDRLLGEVARSVSSPAVSNNVVVSRSVVRKPPRRATSGERLADMKPVYRGAATNPGSLTPRNNRQRLVAKAVLEMSGSDLEMISDVEDDATIDSNASSGSISLRSPGKDPSQRDSPDGEASSHSTRRRSSSQSRKNGVRQRKPQSLKSVNRERKEDDKDADRSSRSERRSRTGGSSGRNRSQSRKRNSRADRRDRENNSKTRSSSMHEKRNSRSSRINGSLRTIQNQTPHTPGVVKRASVTEDEIMDLLTLDYEMPLTNESSKIPRNPRQSRRSSSRDVPVHRISNSSHSETRGVSRSPDRQDSQSSINSMSSQRGSNPAGQSRGIDRSISSETPRLTSRRRTAPRRTKSDDSPALDSFLKQTTPRTSRKTSGSGARSVASMPTKAHVRKQRRPSIGLKGSDRTDDTADTTKPSSLTDSLGPDSDQSGYLDRMGASGTIHYHEGDDSDDEDNQSIDLDLATARNTFVQQNLNEKLQMHLSKTDELLYSVFPRHVADALRNGQKVEPENHDLVTIFFSDIVGFTDISSQLDPMKISDMLDRLYHSFDALSDYHDVFKVETIGDAYMAVTNLAKTQSDHCKRISEFAIDAIRVANQTLIDEDNPDLGFVNIRVGFHSGPVVSNVVGTRNPRYCLFGDTVNTASRMESNSQKNRIHCSEASARLLREQCPKIRIFPRGTIEVKGKGEMRTYWVHTEGSDSTVNANNKNGVIRDGVKNVFKSLRGERARKVSA